MWFGVCRASGSIQFSELLACETQSQRETWHEQFCICGKFDGELNLVVGVETAKLKLFSFACNV